MDVYLRLIKGSDHGHAVPGLPHINTDGWSSHRAAKTHSQLSRGDFRELDRNVDRVSETQARTNQHVVVNPSTGGRFALVPSSVHKGNESRSHVKISPVSQSRGNLVLSPNLLKLVPETNSFERQISEPDIHLAVSLSLPDGPRPVGPLTNNRNKSVQDIINELVKSRSTQARHVVDSKQQNMGSIAQGDHDTDSVLSAVTEMPNIRTTSETQRNRGRMSAILRDRQGYYFMFYPGSGAERVRVKITRTGFCSRGLPANSKQCTIRCTSDSQCTNNYKCCPNGCGLICLPPNGG